MSLDGDPPASKPRTVAVPVEVRALWGVISPEGFFLWRRRSPAVGGAVVVHRSNLQLIRY